MGSREPFSHEPEHPTFRIADMHKEKIMSKLNSIPNISKNDLHNEVRKEYADVALDPTKGIIFTPVGML